MEKRWNINSFLCETADKDVTNIKNIFNNLNIKKSGETSFTIVTLLNAFKSDESCFRLYYYVEEMSDGSIAYLGNSYFKKASGVKKDCNGNQMRGCVEESVSMMLSVNVNHVDFPRSGQYELQVYKYDDTEAEDIDYKEPEEWDDWANVEHLVATYPFTVNIIEE